MENVKDFCVNDEKQKKIVKIYDWGSVITNYENVHVKLNPGLPSQKQQSTGRRFFSPAN